MTACIVGWAHTPFGKMDAETVESLIVRVTNEALENAGIAFESAELTMLPKTTVAVEDEATAKKLLRLMDALEENDDVQAVYANFDIPEGILEAVAA